MDLTSWTKSAADYQEAGHHIFTSFDEVNWFWNHRNNYTYSKLFVSTDIAIE